MRSNSYFFKGGKGTYGAGHTQITDSDVYLNHQSPDLNLIRTLFQENNILKRKIENLQQSVFYNRVFITYDLLEDFSNSNSYNTFPIYFNQVDGVGRLLVDTSKINIDFRNTTVFIKDASEDNSLTSRNRRFVILGEPKPAYQNYIWFNCEYVPAIPYAYDNLGSFMPNNAIWFLGYQREMIGVEEPSSGNTNDSDWLRTDNTPPTNINDTIYTNGNVGIGINNPSANLDIAGNLRVRSLPTGQISDQNLVIDSFGNFKRVNSNRKITFKQSTQGYYEIKIPYGGTNFSIKFKIFTHGRGMEEYHVSGYLNNPNGWIQTYVTKMIQNDGEGETITLTDNGSASDFRIYIGNDPALNRGFSTLFVTEAYRPGIYNQNSAIIEDLSVFEISIQPSITGVVKGTF